jgi:two-component system nitrogen regulation sensor histidine kinase NtrY
VADILDQDGGMTGRTGVRLLPRLAELMLGKAATLVVAVTALGLGIATFAVLSRGMSLAQRPHVEATLLVGNLVVLLLLAATLIGRLARVVSCMCGW